MLVPMCVLVLVVCCLATWGPSGQGDHKVAREGRPATFCQTVGKWLLTIHLIPLSPWSDNYCVYAIGVCLYKRIIDAGTRL